MLKNLFTINYLYCPTYINIFNFLITFFFDKDFTFEVPLTRKLLFYLPQFFLKYCYFNSKLLKNIIFHIKCQKFCFISKKILKYIFFSNNNIYPT